MRVVPKIKTISEQHSTVKTNKSKRTIRVSNHGYHRTHNARKLEGNKYIFVMVDHCTKVVDLEAEKRKRQKRRQRYYLSTVAVIHVQKEY